MLSKGSPVTGELNLGFALQLAGGRGVLSCRDRRVGPFSLKVLELEVPELDGPFDLAGGAEAFKSRRCILRHLAIALSAAEVRDIFTMVRVAGDGFRELKAELRDGYIGFVGRFASGEHQAEVSFKLALLVHDRAQLVATIYDTRVHGWLPIAGPQLVSHVRDALGEAGFGGLRATAWESRPVEQFLRYVMPATGWKVPDTDQADLVGVEISREQIVLVCGRDVDPVDRQSYEREPPVGAVYAAEQVSEHRDVEELLGQGDAIAAYDAYLRQWTSGVGGRWVEHRLLELGVTLARGMEATRDLATELLDGNPEHIQAMLALASVASREGKWGEAEQHLSTVADLELKTGDSHSALAAQLAAARIAERVDPEDARANYERAIERDRGSVIGNMGLFRLHQRVGTWEEARKVGQRLSRLDLEPDVRAGILCDVGAICRDELEDFKQARLAYERALRSVPNYIPALTGLAETFAARGEPARAAVYLARLAEEASRDGRDDDVVSLYLRIGELWETQLKDEQTAGEYYQRVLKVNPRHCPVRFRLATLADRSGELEQARLYYEDILTLAEDPTELDSEQYVIDGNLRLADVILRLEGRTQAAANCYERVLALNPDHVEALTAICPLLNELRRYERLVRVQERLAHIAEDPAEERRLLVSTARLLQERLSDLKGARRLLALVLEHEPDDAEALDLLMGILQLQGDADGLSQLLSRAAEASEEPQRRVELYLELSDVLADLGAPVDKRADALRAALDLEPLQPEAADELLRLVNEDDAPEVRADALERRVLAGAESAERYRWLLEAADIRAEESDDSESAARLYRDATAVVKEGREAWFGLARVTLVREGAQAAYQILLEGLSSLKHEQEDAIATHRQLAGLAQQASNLEAEVVHLDQLVDFKVAEQAEATRLLDVLTELERLPQLCNRLEAWALTGELLETEALYMRSAEVREKLGETDRAFDIYEMLVRQRGYTANSAARAMEMLARGNRDLGRIERALLMQLEVAPEADRASIFERLASLRIEHHPEPLAEKTCEELVAINPFSPLGHSYLARCRDERKDYRGALDHWLKALARTKQPRVSAAIDLRAAYQRAALLAQELAPWRIEELSSLYELDFPGEEFVLGESLGKHMELEGRFEELVELRHMQDAEDCYFGAEPISFEIGRVYEERLDDQSAALRNYDACVRAAPDGPRADTCRARMRAILEDAQRWPELAELLWRFSRDSAEPLVAIEFGLDSVDIYTGKLARPEDASMVLQQLTEVGEPGPYEARFLTHLREQQLHAEVCGILRRSLQKQWDVEDGRFTEVVGLLAGVLGSPEDAIALAEDAVEAFAYLDIPHRVLTDLLKDNASFGDPIQTLSKWAEAREGEARLEVLLEAFELLEEREDRARATETLEEATECAPEPLAIIERIISRHIADESYESALKWSEEALAHTYGAEERAALHEQIARLALDECAEPDAAQRAIVESAHPQPLIEHLVDYYIDIEDFAQALTWLEKLAETYPQGAERDVVLERIGDLALAKANSPQTAESVLSELRSHWALADRLIDFYQEHGDLRRAADWLERVASQPEAVDGREARLERMLDLGLGDLEDVGLGHRAVELSERPAGLIERLIEYHLGVNELAEALDWLERLVGRTEPQDLREVHLYRLVDLALKRAKMPERAERAIALSHKPAELIERLYSYLIAHGEYEEGFAWLGRLRELSSSPAAAELFVDRMMGLSLDQAELPELAERAIELSDERPRQIERLLTYYKLQGETESALTWLWRLASAFDDSGEREGTLERIVDYALNTAEIREQAEQALEQSTDPQPLLELFFEHDHHRGERALACGHIDRMVEGLDAPNERDAWLTKELELALLEPVDIELAESAVERATLKVALIEPLVEALLERELYSKALHWLAIMAEGTVAGPMREATLRRLLDLALAGGNDLSAAERAIQLSGEPAPLVESLVENRLSRSDYRSVVPWLHFLIEQSTDEERPEYVARLFELGLGFLEDGRVAEEALGFLETPGELVGELIAWFEEHERYADCFRWLMYLAERTEDDEERQALAVRIHALALGPARDLETVERALALAVDRRPLIEKLVESLLARGQAQEALGWQLTLGREAAGPERRAADLRKALDIALYTLGDVARAEVVIEASDEPFPLMEALVSYHRDRGDFAGALQWLWALVKRSREPVAASLYRHRLVDLALGEAKSVGEAERAVLDAKLEPGLTEKLISYRLGREDWGDALRWLEELAQNSTSENNPWLRRMFDLAVGDAEDVAAAERAIAMAPSPVALIEKLVDYLLGQEAYHDALRWMEHLARDGSVEASPWLRRMFELALGRAQDLAAAERAIEMAEEPTALIEKLVDYLLEQERYADALRWMEKLALSAPPENNPWLRRMFELGLGLAGDLAASERAIAMAVDPTGLIEKLVEHLIATERFGEALGWLEQLASSAESDADPWVRRMFDLSLGAADDLAGAERAIGLASDPAVLIEDMIAYLQGRERHEAALRWLETRIDQTRDTKAREPLLMRMVEAALDDLKDVSVAERAIGMSRDPSPLIDELVGYHLSMEERDDAIRWLLDGIDRESESALRLPHIERVLDVALESPEDYPAVERAIALAERGEVFLERYIQHLLDKEEYSAARIVILDLAEHVTLESEREACLERALSLSLGVLSQPDEAERVIALSQRPAPLIEELITWYLERGDYEHCLAWTRKLITEVPHSDERDAVRRRVAELALGFTDDHRMAIEALSNLEEPDSSERGELANLYLSAGDYDALYSLLPTLNGVEPALFMRAAKHHLRAGELDRARFYLQGGLERGSDDDEVWALARPAWREAGRGVQLGQWMLERAAAISPRAPHRLRLDAFRQMLDAGSSPETLGPPELIVAQLDLADLDNLGEAMLTYRCAVAVGDRSWENRAAEALENLLGESDPIYPDVLRSRIRHEQARYDYASAARLARRLLALGEDDAQVVLEQALAEGGESAELLTVLHTRLAKGDGARSVLLMRIARIHRQAERWHDVATTLVEVEPEERELLWGELAWETGEQRMDDALRAAAASVCAEHAKLPADQAMWCRREAEIRWWALDQQEDGEDLLRQAQLLSPRGLDAWMQLAAEGDDAWAVRRLSEGLVSFPDDEGLALILELARIRQRTGKPELASDLLEDAARRCRGGAESLAMVGQQAYHFGLGSLQIRVLEEAHSLDDIYYRALHDSLIGNGQYERVVKLLEGRFEVERKQGDTALALGRLVEAANCARLELADPEQALSLMLRAVDCEPRQSLIEHALVLTFELEDAECRLKLLALLLDQTEGDEARAEVLRHRLEAAEILGDFEAEVKALEDLVELGHATSAEKIQLASLVFDKEPGQSAKLYHDVAVGRTSTDAGQLFFEACLAHRAARDEAAAAEVCIEALKAGFRNTGVYEVALELLEGSHRADVLEDYLADGGDHGWDLHRNISVRLELAALRLDQNRPQPALVAIDQAAAYGETRELYNLRERALTQNKDMATLCNWYVSESDRVNTEWGREEMIDRLKTAARHYRSVGSFDVERSVVGRILHRGDRDPAYFDRALTLAERDRDLSEYLSLANQRLAIAIDSPEVEGLTLFLGNQLAEAFAEPEAAIGLWRERLEASPSVAVADALAGLYDECGQQRDAYELYRYLMELLPARRDIFDESLVRACHLELWEDACQLLFRRIEQYETRDEEILETLTRIAEIAGRYLIDRAIELEAIEKYLKRTQGRCGLAGRLVTRYTEEGRFSEAFDILKGGRVESDVELGAATSLLEHIGEQAAGGELEAALIAWILQHYGETELGQRLRLEQARQHGDEGSLLGELERTLEHPALSVDDEESVSLHTEAAELAERAGDSARALTHLLHVLDEDESSIEDVYRALLLADEVSDDEK